MSAEMGFCRNNCENRAVCSSSAYRTVPCNFEGRVVIAMTHDICEYNLGFCTYFPGLYISFIVEYMGCFGNRRRKKEAFIHYIYIRAQ